MRLFIAINLSMQTKENIYNVITYFKRHGAQGKFSLKENLHLTLAFIGETELVDDIKRAMDGVSVGSFMMRIEGMGRFKRSGGDIYWLGIADGGELVRLHGELTQRLGRSGFEVEEQEYKPHMTIGRQIIIPKDFDMHSAQRMIAPMEMRVNKISLMKSERIAGRLTYTEIYSKALK